MESSDSDSHMKWLTPTYSQILNLALLEVLRSLNTEDSHTTWRKLETVISSLTPKERGQIDQAYQQAKTNRSKALKRPFQASPLSRFDPLQEVQALISVEPQLHRINHTLLQALIEVLDRNGFLEKFGIATKKTGINRLEDLNL